VGKRKEQKGGNLNPGKNNPERPWLARPHPQTKGKQKKLDAGKCKLSALGAGRMGRRKGPTFLNRQVAQGQQSKTPVVVRMTRGPCGGGHAAEKERFGQTGGGGGNIVCAQKKKTGKK